MDFFIGSFTNLDGPGVGRCRLENKRLSLICSDSLPNATYVILNREQTLLFAISSDPVDAHEGGSVASYDIKNGGLKRISHQDTIGAGPCHLCLSQDERFLYTANYLTGSVSVFPVNVHGEVGRCVQHVRHEGHSVHPVRQSGPHAHQVIFIPETNLLCAVDLGLDALMVYQQNAATGRLTFFSRTGVSAGLGPRHLICAQSGFAYLVCEVGNQVLKLRWNGKTFDTLQALSTLPAGFSGENTAAAIRLNREESKLLVSNRGYDSIAVYNLDAHGKMTLDAICATAGFPRDFAMINDTDLLIGHQKGKLTLERLNGKELVIMDSLPINGCVCTLIPRMPML